MLQLNQNLAATIIVGPVLDINGLPFTGALTRANFQIFKAGATNPVALDGVGTAPTHYSQGLFELTLTGLDTNTQGYAEIILAVASYAMDTKDLLIGPAAIAPLTTIYDSLGNLLLLQSMQSNGAPSWASADGTVALGLAFGSGLWTYTNTSVSIVATGTGPIGTFRYAGGTVTTTSTLTLLAGGTPQSMRDAMSLAPSAGVSPAILSIDWDLDAIMAQTALIGSGGGTISSPWSESGDLQIFQGDTYALSNGRQIAIANTAGSWAGGTIASATLTISGGGVIVLQKTVTTSLTAAGQITSATGSQAAFFQLSKADTTSLTTPGRSYDYQVKIKDAAGDAETDLAGAVVVFQSNNPNL